MVGPEMVMDNCSILRRDRSDSPLPTPTPRNRPAIPRFGLSVAMGLPPAALLVAGSAMRPARVGDEAGMLGQPELAAILGRPTAQVLWGRIALGAVDKRLRGLESLLHVFQVTDETG